MATVSDTFTRSVSGGWGTATTGQAWTVTGTAADYSVTGSVGRQAQPAANTLHASYLTVGSVGQTTTAKVTVPVVPTGAGITAWVLGRLTDASNYYAATLGISTSGTVTLVIQKRVSGTLSTVSSTVGVSGTHAAGSAWRITLSVAGSAVRAKAWKDGTTEPTAWAIEATDASLASGTGAGVAARTESGNTNGAVNIDWDDFTSVPVEVTATQQDVYPPRVLVSVTGLTVGDSVEVYRVVGTDRTLVRAGSDDSVSDTSFLRVDAEIPFGVPVSYVAVVNGATEYATGSTTYTLTSGLPVVTDAVTGLSAETKILAWDEKRYNRQSSVFRVGGRNVVVSDDYGMFEGTIEFFTEATSSRDNLMTVLADATEGVVQLRQPGGYDGVDAYLAVTGVSERRFSQDGSDTRRIIAVDVVETEAWASNLEARGFTYADLEAAYTGLTYANLQGDYSTYLALAQADLA